MDLGISGKVTLVGASAGRPGLAIACQALTHSVLRLFPKREKCCLKSFLHDSFHRTL